MILSCWGEFMIYEILTYDEFKFTALPDLWIPLLPM